MNLTNWLTSPMAQSLGWTLIHALWQGFAVVLTVAVLLHLTRHSQAALRYKIGLGGLLTQVLASAGTFGWQYEPRSSVVHTAPMGHSSGEVPMALLASAPESWLVTTQAFLNGHLAQVVWVWLIGVGIFGVRLVGGWLYVQRLRSTATLPVPVPLLNAAARIAQKMNLSVRLQLTARVTGPLVVGVVKPVVLWPVGLLAGLSAADLEAILAHELAHVRRHDYLLNVLQSTIEVLYFFHPALWWLSARVREEREHCCDDLAVQVVGDGRVVARALARVEEWQRDPLATPTLAMAFASRRQLLLQRVRRMLGVPTRPLVSNSSLVGLTLGTLLLVSMSLYAVQRVEPPKPARAMPPHTTRRHTLNSDSEYGMIDTKRMSYVIWKGQRLSAARVTRLQRQFDLVMASRLSLDVVKQPDRDILLAIIETNHAFDGGMQALTKGLAHINYTNSNANAPDTVNKPDKLLDSVRVDGKWVDISAQYVKPYKYKRYNAVNVNGKWIDISAQYVKQEELGTTPALAGDTSRLRSVQRQLEALTKELQAIMAERQPVADRLSKEMAELGVKNGAYQKQLAPVMNQINQLTRQQQLLALKLIPLNTEIRRLSIQNTAKAKELVRQKEAQSERIEQQINEVDAQIEKLSDQMEQLTPYQERMEVLADSMERLYEPTNALSEKMGELSEQLAEEAERHAAEPMRANAAGRGKYSALKGEIVRPARAPRPPRSVGSARPPRTALAPAAPRPAVKVNGSALAPVPKPASVPKPTPAPAPAPKVH